MTLSSSHIKHLARKCGFELCSVTKIKNISEQQNHIDEWISRNHNGTMDWFANNCEKRINPTLLLENAKSIIVCGKFYNPKITDTPRIAKYALSTDYHYTIKHQLNEMLNSLEDTQGGCFTDSAPILEKYWARESGLGWIGKNGLITTEQYGSMINLGIIIINHELDQYDTVVESKCGNCRKCIDACPSNVLSRDSFDSRNCLSYITIEHHEELSYRQKQLLQSSSNTMFFGCDKCIDACPWNNRAILTKPPTHIVESKFNLTLNQWKELSSSQFNKHYRNTPLQRAGIKKIRETIEILTSTSKLL